MAASDTLKVPPTEDFTAFNGLVAKQGDHLGGMIAWAGKQCVDGDGLDGLLSELKPYLPQIAQPVGAALQQSQRGMGLITGKVSAVDRQLRDHDAEHAAALNGLFPDRLSGVGDLSMMGTPTGAAADFGDRDVQLKEPVEPGAVGSSLLVGRTLGKIMDPAAPPPKEAPKLEGSSFKKARDYLAGKFYAQLEPGNPTTPEGAYHKWVSGAGSDIFIADKAFQLVTGHSFVDMTLKPLVGDWDRLMYLSDAYDTLGDACYTVAGNLRKGSWKIGQEWAGATATAFDSYMFRWANGIGGVGDCCKQIAERFEEAYEAIMTLIQTLLTYVSKLIDKEIKKLALDAAETVAGDAAIEVVGLGPEDPVADGVAAVWTAARMAKIYQDVRMVVNGLEQVQSIYADIQKYSAEIPKIESELKQLWNPAPWGDGSTTGLIEDVEWRGYYFESADGWSSKDGAARVALLPKA
ncbi:hypothetical protein [Nocardia stercoris]|uniref:WXG100 family type VII secretion target n=1 Tax=Nocardia stercoris TaxID=2483361 RepID=A0A3M2LD75_9NOCA|nr:hypothetical protein [Nocardia stercoris]RMI35479.1 hypothetical protein EBN03_04275 [Nocardia stercoris]